mgnify:CR=1 FL=1
MHKVALQLTMIFEMILQVLSASTMYAMSYDEGTWYLMLVGVVEQGNDEVH